MRKDVPVALSILVIHAGEVLLPSRLVNAQLQRLVHVTREIFGVVRAYLYERLDILLDLRRREAPHEI